MNSKMRHSRPLRVTLSTTLRENTELGIAKISRSKLRMVVRYHPTSSTMPSTGCSKNEMKMSFSKLKSGYMPPTHYSCCCPQA